MANVIDRRLNPRDKNLSNRQRFIARTKEQIKRAVTDAINDGKISDVNGKVKVPISGGIKEPVFGHDRQTGNRKHVVPGNQDFVEGDTIARPSGGEGSGGGSASADGEGEDSFEFTLTKEEFLDFFFDDLELPDLVKKQISNIVREEPRRAGYTVVGNPSQLDIRMTMRNAIGRRIALNRPKREEIEALEDDEDETAKIELDEAKRRMKAIPWIDPVDVRYRNFVPQPKPITRAVMVCILDVSGSMDQREKDIAKRFFMLLYMFLTRKYENVDIVFIRHHSEAEECNEYDFFYKKESGGTMVSTALVLANEIIRERYPLDTWNIYVAQASDGDNFSYDNERCREVMQMILNLVQYFAYLDIPREPGMFDFSSDSELWRLYTEISRGYSTLNMKKAINISQIWAVFKELFGKDINGSTA